jgi:hypothetical protein
MPKIRIIILPANRNNDCSLLSVLIIELILLIKE